MIFFNTELIQPSRKIVLKVGSVYSKGICFFNKLVRSASLGLYFIMSLTLLLNWLFLLVDFWLACSLGKGETYAKWLWTIDGLKSPAKRWFFYSVALQLNLSSVSQKRFRRNAIPCAIPRRFIYNACETVSGISKNIYCNVIIFEFEFKV